METGIRALSGNKTLVKIETPLELNLIIESINQRAKDIDIKIYNYNLLKGERLFLKEFVSYYEYQSYSDSICGPYISVNRNKKENRVILKIKKDKLWYPLTKNQEMQVKQARSNNLWK